MLVYLLFLDKKIITLISSTTLKTHSLAPEQVYYESHALKMIDFEQEKERSPKTMQCLPLYRDAKRCHVNFNFKGPTRFKNPD